MNRKWPFRLLASAVLCTGILTGCDTLFGPEYVGPEIWDPTYYPTCHEHPSWSPLGLVIYEDTGVVWRDDGTWYIDDGLYGVWTIEISSGLKRQVVSGRAPSWSADGMSFVYVGSGGVTVASLSGSVLSEFGVYGMYPDLKPDGTRVAWSHSSGSTNGLWSAALDGSDMTRHLKSAFEPDWHPTDEIILCDAWVDTLHGIIEVNPWVSGTAPHFVKLSDPDAHIFYDSAEYSRDGQYIVCVRSGYGSSWTSEAWVMSSDGSSERMLVPDPATHPSWSPDGTKVVYVREALDQPGPEYNVLWIADVVTGELTQLTHRWTEETAAEWTGH